MPAGLSATFMPDAPIKTGLQIQTKFKPGDEFWCLIGDAPCLNKVFTINIYISTDGSFTEMVRGVNGTSYNSDKIGRAKEELKELVFK